MSGPASVQRVLDNYLKLYVRPEWQETTQAVLTPLADHLGGLQQEAGTIDLDPNWVDDLLGSLADDGHDVEAVLAVLADALEFLCTRRVIAANPLATAAHGETNRLSRTPTAVSAAAQPSPAAPPPAARSVHYRTLWEALDYLFPVNPITGVRMRRGFCESTIMGTYLPKWRKLFAFLEGRGITAVRQVKRSDIKAFVDQLSNVQRKRRPKSKAEQLAPQTVNGYIHAFRAFWKQLIDDGAITSEEDPTAVRSLTVRKRNREIRDALSMGDLARLLSHLDRIEDEFKRRSLRALFIAEAFGGPRVSEAVAFNFENINWATGVIHIERGKGDIERDTVLIQAALDDLKWLKEHRGAQDSDALFVNLRRGRGKLDPEQRISENTAWRWVSTVGKDVGVYMCNHTLRHTAGTLAEQFGGPAYRRAIGVEDKKGKANPHSMALLGHSSPVVNAGYNHVPLDAVRVVMEEAYRYARAGGDKADGTVSIGCPAPAA